MTNIESWPEYYKARFSTKAKAEAYLAEKRRTRDAMFLAIQEHVGVKGLKLLEAGCGTSTASVILNLDGAETDAMDLDPEMLSIANGLNETMDTNVNYSQGSIFDIDAEYDSYDGIFSHGVIEHFSEEDVVRIVNEGLRVAPTYVLSFPTVNNWSPDLRGDENPWGYFRWKNTLQQTDGSIARVYSMFSKRRIRERINLLADRRIPWFAPNLVFVLKRK